MTATRDPMLLLLYLWSYVRFEAAGIIAAIATLGLQTAYALFINIPLSSVVSLDVGSVGFFAIGGAIHYYVATKFRVVAKPHPKLVGS